MIKRLVVRVENDPRGSGEVPLVDKDGVVVMLVPWRRVACRLRKDERVAFFYADIGEDDTLHLGDRAPVEKQWATTDVKGVSE